MSLANFAGICSIVVEVFHLKAQISSSSCTTGRLEIIKIIWVSPPGTVNIGSNLSDN